MRKTGLCGVVIATLFGTAGLLQHPSHQVVKQHVNHQQSTSPLAQAGVNLLNSYSAFGGQQAAHSVTLLPDGFLRVIHKPGPTPAQLAAYDKAVAGSNARSSSRTLPQQQAAASRSRTSTSRSRSCCTSASTKQRHKRAGECRGTSCSRGGSCSSPSR